MHDRAKVATRKPWAKRENSVTRITKTDFSQSMSSPIDQILHLQRTIGNQAVQRLFKSGVIQAKLRIGKPNDIYEREADRVAEQMMRMPEPTCPECKEEKETIQTERSAGQITPLVQRQVEEEEEEILLIKGYTDQTPEVTGDIESRINSIGGGGQPLPESFRNYFEPRLGYDFGRVQIHFDARAAEMAKALNARAFTVGHNLYFGAGYLEPKTVEGKKLIAHELVHVMQQTRTKNNLISGRHIKTHVEGTTAFGVQRQVAGLAEVVGEKKEVEESKAHYPSREILDGAIQNMIEDIVEKAVPPAKYAIIAGKLAMAFGKGVGKGIERARKELRDRYSAIMKEILSKSGEGLTEEDIEKLQFIRRWQANSLKELNGILEEGIRSVIREVIGMVSEELAGQIVEEPLEDLGDAVGDFVGDVLTGDYVGPMDFISQEAEDRVQETIKNIVSSIGDAFAKSVAGYAIKEGMIEIQIRDLLIGNGLPEDVAIEVATGMGLEMVGVNVSKKIGRIRNQMMEGWESEAGRFFFAFAKLVELRKKYKEMYWFEKLFTDEDEKLEEDISKWAEDAWGALFNLDNIYLPVRRLGFFKPDMTILQKYKYIQR